MKLNNKQWMWKNWQKVYLSFSILLILPLIFILVFSIKGILFYLSGALGAISLLIIIYSLLMTKDIDNYYINEILNSDLLKYTFSNNLDALKLLHLTTEELNFPLPNGLCLLTIASVCGDEELIKYFIENKVKIQKDVDSKLSHPIHLAALSGNTKIVKLLIDYFKGIEGENFKINSLSQFQLNCFLGDREKVLAEAKEFSVHEKDCFGQSALFYSLVGNVDELIILHLLKLKAHINSKGKILVRESMKKREIVFEEVSAVHLAFGKVSEEVLLEILSREKKYEVDSSGTTVFMKAAEMGYLKVLNKLKDYVDVLEKDKKGNDVIFYAKLGKQIQAEKMLREWVDLANEKRRELQSKRRSQDIALGAKINPDEIVKIEYEDLKLMINSSLRGMVGVDEFINNFAHDLKSFMDRKNGSVGIVLWGNSSVGKTEISRRLSGTYKENIAKFQLPGVDVKYIACCDSDIDVKKIIDSISKKTVLFLDEIDKYLSPSSGIVNESQAKGLRTSFLTNFESKDIFWIFTGTFSDIRGSKKLNRDILEKTLGQELSSRLDFVDYMLPDWTVVTLLKAAKNVFVQDQLIDYEDDAILKLVNYTLKHQGGVRSLEKNHEIIRRKFRNELASSEKILVTSSIVNEIIEKENQE